jgi:hypothetical protein
MAWGRARLDGGEGDKSLWSEERARGGGPIAPHGSGGNHWISLESSGNVDDDAQSPERARGLGLGLDADERGGAAGWAGLVRPNPLGLV